MARKDGHKGTSAQDGPIRILHLSDFHLSPERRWDSDPVLVRLAETIGGLANKGLAPDLVAITGDVADKGRAKDYAEAKRWIDSGLRPALPGRLAPARILFVPGNHDVDRTKVNEGSRALQSGLLAGGQDAIADVLGDPAQRGTLLKRHNAYLKFVNGFRSADDDGPSGSW